MASATAADGARIHYRAAGSGPVVVFTHGLGSHLDAWEATVRIFRNRYTVLTWDVRGFGGSERRPDTMAPATWASDLAAVLDDVGADDAVIGGISMGGVVSQRFALDYPERTRALILISTSSEVNQRAEAGWNARADLIERDGLAKALTPTGPALSYGKEYRERTPTRSSNPRASPSSETTQPATRPPAAPSRTSTTRPTWRRSPARP